MDNYQQVLLQMEEFGVEFNWAKDKELRYDTPKRVTFGKGGKYWYRLYLFRRDDGGCYITGSFGTYRHGGDWRKVQVDYKPMSDAERERFRAERRAAVDKAEAERKAEAALAALGAAELLARANREGRSPYLERKQVAGESCRYLPDGTLVIPLMRYDLPREQRLQAVQRILPSGRKLYSKGFEKPGCMVRLGEAPSEEGGLLLVGEGYATGLSLRMACDCAYPVFVALDAGNLASAVPLLRTLYPLAWILICADDDWQTRDPHTGELINPGRTASKAIAREVSHCDFVWPQFAAATRQEKDTDFNDLHVREGLDAVRGQLSGVIAAMQRRYG